MIEPLLTYRVMFLPGWFLLGERAGCEEAEDDGEELHFDDVGLYKICAADM